MKKKKKRRNQSQELPCDRCETTDEWIADKKRLSSSTLIVKAPLRVHPLSQSASQRTRGRHGGGLCEERGVQTYGGARAGCYCESEMKKRRGRKKKKQDRTSFWQRGFRLLSNAPHPSTSTSTLLSLSTGKPFLNSLWMLARQERAIHGHNCQQTRQSKCSGGTGHLLCYLKQGAVCPQQATSSKINEKTVPAAAANSMISPQHRSDVFDKQ